MDRPQEHPPGAASLMHQGQALVGAGRYREAVAAFATAASIDPELGDAWFQLAACQHTLGQHAEALVAIGHVRRQRPGDAAVQLALAEVLFALDRFAQALAHYEPLFTARPTDTMLGLRMARCRRRLGQHAAAHDILRACVARAPDHALAWLEFGDLAEDLGDRDGAREAYLHAHRLAPNWAPPLACALTLDALDPNETLLHHADALLATVSLPVEQRALLQQALGKVADRRGEFGTAARHWTDANRLRRAEDGPFDRAAHARRVNDIIEHHTAQALERAPQRALQGVRPIFVVGMPRSGTTLVEQVLSAHPDTTTYGESDALPSLMDDLDHTLPNTEAPTHPLAHRYLQQLGHGAEAPGTRPVDKQPWNMLNLGVIATLFADARVIWCRRDPRDIALSIYSESFAPKWTYATDLDDIRFVIAEQERLLAHWRHAAILPLLEVDYAAFVSDPEAGARQLLAFLGLPWHPACLESHRHGRPVQTLSRWQVRAPVYTTSVGRWRHYPHWFAEH